MSVEPITSDEGSLELVLEVEDIITDLVASIDSQDYGEALTETLQIKEIFAAIEIFLTEKAEKANG
jgi:hypothetical protein